VAGEKSNQRRCAWPARGSDYALSLAVFHGATEQIASLERQLFLFRKAAEAALGDAAYFCSLSSRTVVYKGLLSPRQLPEFYPTCATRTSKLHLPSSIKGSRPIRNQRGNWRSLFDCWRITARSTPLLAIGGG